jgi:hypothetical protein
VTVSVADHGPGIPPEDRHRVFEPYFTRKADGTGLGLAIVKQVVDLHRGGLRLEETPGGGATFVMTLPVRPVLARIVAEPAPAAPQPATYLAPDGESLPDRRATDRRRSDQAGPTPPSTDPRPSKPDAR